jgi:hypothetical protein
LIKKEKFHSFIADPGLSHNSNEKNLFENFSNPGMNAIFLILVSIPGGILGSLMNCQRIKELETIREANHWRQQDLSRESRIFIYKPELFPSSPKSKTFHSFPPREKDLHINKYMAMNFDAQSWSFPSLYQALNNILCHPHFKIEKKECILLYQRLDCLLLVFRKKIDKLLNGLIKGEERNLSDGSTLDGFSNSFEEFNILFNIYKVDSEFWAFFWIIKCNSSPIIDFYAYKFSFSNEFVDFDRRVFFDSIQGYLGKIPSSCPGSRLAKANLKSLLKRFE